MESNDIKEIGKQIEKEYPVIKQIQNEASKVIVGQTDIIEKFIIGLIAGGHVLIEGVPGLAKTLTIKTLSDIIQTKFKRIQFTPDMLPADIIGTTIYNPQKHEFTTKKGPVFANLILADEINRAPAKVQSALLEAMEEHQVTIGDETYLLEEPFMVMATQNPLEQEGTYPLPEAQIDRFMMKLKIGYPSKDDELKIMERMTAGEKPSVSSVIAPEDIMRIRKLLPSVYMDAKIGKYIVDLIFATREPEKYDLKDIKDFIGCGASPRATLALASAARAEAFIAGRAFVTPDDVKAVAYDVLRHRIILTYEAEAEEIDSDGIIKELLAAVDVP
ncbi:MAG: AAA family ATPase [bacterium]|nr:AAA family ATPase [bacterium]